MRREALVQISSRGWPFLHSATAYGTCSSQASPFLLIVEVHSFIGHGNLSGQD